MTNTAEKTLFYTINGNEITFNTTENDSAIEILIENVRFQKDRCRQVKRILIELFCYGLITFFIYPKIMLNGVVGSVINVGFLLLFIYEIYSLLNLVQFEKLDFIEDFCLQYTTKYLVGTKHIYLPSANIHDVVINEVIYGFRVIYVLVVLTKGTSFGKKPIIPLLSSLNPSVKCLKIIYNLLQDKLDVSHVNQN